MPAIDISAPGASATGLQAALDLALKRSQTHATGATLLTLDPVTRYHELTSGGTAGDEHVDLPLFPVDVDTGYNAERVGAVIVVSLKVQTDPADRVVIKSGGSGNYPLFQRRPADPEIGITAGGVILDFPLATAAFVWTGYGYEVWRALANGNDDSASTGSNVSMNGGSVQSGSDSGGTASVSGGSVEGGTGIPGQVSIAGGNQDSPDGTSDGGALHLSGGHTQNSGQSGGAASIQAGQGVGTGTNGGLAEVLGGVGNVNGGAAHVEGGAGGTNGGDAFLFAGAGTNGPGGEAWVNGGGSNNSTGGNARLQGGGVGAAQRAGDAIVEGGDGGSTGTPGDVVLTPGQASGSVGHVKVTDLPSADPHVANALWNSAGTLKISAG